LNIASAESRKTVNHECEAFKYLLRKYGVRFLGGFAMPLDLFKEIKPELDSAIKRIEDAVDLFVFNYDSEQRKWQDKNPKYAAAIARKALTKEQARERYSAGYTVTRVCPIDDDSAKAELESQVNGLYGEIIAGINKKARESLQKYQEDNEISSMCKNTFTSMIERLRPLAFLDNRINVLIQHIGNVLAALPKKGKVIGGNYFLVISTMQTLSKRESVENLIEGKINLGAMAANSALMAQSSSRPVQVQTVPQVQTVQTVVQPVQPVQSTAPVADPEALGLFSGLMDEDPDKAEVEADAPAVSDADADMDALMEAQMRQYAEAKAEAAPLPPAPEPEAKPEPEPEPSEAASSSKPEPTATVVKEEKAEEDPKKDESFLGWFM
jgi:hypothetical protein